MCKCNLSISIYIHKSRKPWWLPQTRLYISLLCTWFRQRVSIALHQSLAHAKHVTTLRLVQSVALLPPPPLHAQLSIGELCIVANIVQYDRLTYLSVSGYVVSIQARSSPSSFFNNTQLPLIWLVKGSRPQVMNNWQGKLKRYSRGQIFYEHAKTFLLL